MKLRKDLWAELQPEGCLEEETAVGIVHDVWLKRRLMRTINLGYRRDPFGVEVAKASPKDWDELVNVITADAENKDTLTTDPKGSLAGHYRSRQKNQ
jgi:hypothetical protein